MRSRSIRSNISSLRRSVEISGGVRTPGKYWRSDGLTVSKLMILAGGITQDASVDSIEVTRIDTTNEHAIAKTFQITLPPDYWQVDSLHDFLLQDLDHVTIKLSPKFSLPRLVADQGRSEISRCVCYTHSGGEALLFHRSRRRIEVDGIFGRLKAYPDIGYMPV